jgi:hypothetical protein
MVGANGVERGGAPRGRGRVGWKRRGGGGGRTSQIRGGGRGWQNKPNPCRGEGVGVPSDEARLFSGSPR